MMLPEDCVINLPSKNRIESVHSDDRLESPIYDDFDLKPNLNLPILILDLTKELDPQPHFDLYYEPIDMYLEVKPKPKPQPQPTNSQADPDDPFGYFATLRLIVIALCIVRIFCCIASGFFINFLFDAEKDETIPIDEHQNYRKYYLVALTCLQVAQSLLTNVIGIMGVLKSSVISSIVFGIFNVGHVCLDISLTFVFRFTWLTIFISISIIFINTNYTYQLYCKRNLEHKRVFQHKYQQGFIADKEERPTFFNCLRVNFLSLTLLRIPICCLILLILCHILNDEIPSPDDSDIEKHKFIEIIMAMLNMVMNFDLNVMALLSVIYYHYTMISMYIYLNCFCIFLDLILAIQNLKHPLLWINLIGSIASSIMAIIYRKHLRLTPQIRTKSVW